jgi:DNA-binding MarR family transcriptional regulator
MAKEHVLSATGCERADETDVGEATVLQILRVADLLTRIGDLKLFGKTLTQPQFNILMILKHYGQDEMSQKEIMEYLVSTKGNLSIHVKNLVLMGHIRKRTSKVDTRMNTITLTAKGKRVLAALETKYIEHLQKITNKLSSSKARVTLEVLDYLHDRCTAELHDAGNILAQGAEA